MSAGFRGLHCNSVDFISLINFEWHRHNEVRNIGILVLRRDCEKLYYRCETNSFATYG